MGGAIKKAGRIASPAFRPKVIWRVVMDACAGRDLTDANSASRVPVRVMIASWSDC